MTANHISRRESFAGRWLPAFLAILATLPGLLIRFNLIDGSDPVRALWYGVAIVGAAFMLSWAAEAFQIDVSAGLALALLALIAILPEYRNAGIGSRLLGTELPPTAYGVKRGPPAAKAAASAA